MNPARAVARIHIANGGWIADAVNTPGALEIAYADPRPPALRKEYAQTRALIVDRLREVGRADLEPQIDRNLGAVQVPEIGPWVGMGVARLGEMGLPAAVFLMPPDNG
jgi:hypothetical protein